MSLGPYALFYWKMGVKIGVKVKGAVVWSLSFYVAVV